MRLAASFLALAIFCKQKELLGRWCGRNSFFGKTLNTRTVGTSPFKPAVSLQAFTASDRAFSLDKCVEPLLTFSYALRKKAG